MSLVTLFVAAYVLVAIGALIALRFAPLGFEDQEGFHVGEPPADAPEPDGAALQDR